MSIVKFDNVTRIYTSGDHELKALNKVSFTLDEGKFVVILGPSGAGKSTLLNLLGGLDSPTEGTITVNGRDISTLSDNELADYRAATVGFVFQFYNLIPTLTVYENVELVTLTEKLTEVSEQNAKLFDKLDGVHSVSGLTGFRHLSPARISLTLVIPLRECSTVLKRAHSGRSTASFPQQSTVYPQVFPVFHNFCGKLKQILWKS